MEHERLLCAILRTDFQSFLERVFREVAPGETLVTGWHLQALCYALSEVARGNRRRQIVEVPPRSLKSVAASVALVAWVLGHDPTRKIIVISYAQQLALIHSSACRQVMKSTWYRALFPATQIGDKDTEGYFRTTRGGFRDATSIGGVLTGKGADLIIIDDPIKPDDAMSEAHRTAANEWYRRTLVSRLNNKQKDAILLVMQRLHVDDLAGHVRSLDHWDVLTVPAIAEADQSIEVGHGQHHHRKRGEVLDPVREPLEVLMNLKASMGSFAFSAQYQQQPLSADSGVVDWDWFRRFGTPPERSRGVVSQSWDMASKDTEFADYSVCTTWLTYNGDFFLLDLFRARLAFPALLRAVVSQAERWQPKEILIEDAAAGTHVVPSLRLDRPSSMPVPLLIKPEKDKITRLHSVSPIIEQGRVYLPNAATWLEELRAELVTFPHGRYDDQVDSISQFLGREQRKRLNPAATVSVPMFGSRRELARQRV